MASETVTFARNYDHTWPSRSVTAYKAGWSGRVKGEVAEAARAAGALEGLPTVRAELDALAVAEGVDLAAIVGTGANGRVVNDDVTAAILANRAGRTGDPHDQREPGAFLGGGDGPAGGEAPTE